MKNKNILPILCGGVAFLALPLNVQAQEQAKDTTLTRTVVVEQEYNPNIRDAAKVNVLPRIEEPTVSKKAVEYNETLQPASRLPIGTMRPYVIREKQDKTKAGYARLGYGIYNNLDARANYLFTLSPKDRLNLTFAMDGRNGDLDMGEGVEDWKSRYYRTQARVDYLHNFKTLDLNVAGNFGLHNFNLQPGTTAGKQKFTSGDVHVGVASTDKNLPVQFKAETNLMLYERQNGLSIDGNALKDIRETLIRTKADVWGDISEKSGIGLGFDMDNYFYDKLEYATHSGLKNYTEIVLSPHYLFHNNGWEVRLGLHLDVLLGNVRNNDFLVDRVFLSPDVKAQYTFADSYQVYAQVTGEKQANDFRRLELTNPYANVPYFSTSTYEFFNAALGFKASPLTGLWLHLYGGFQSLIDDLYAGPSHSSQWGIRYNQEDIYNSYAGLDLTYSYRDIVTFSGKGIFHQWEDEASRAHLYLKPAFELYLNLDVRPMEALTINLGHEFISREGENPGKAKSVNNLYAGATYELFDGISIYAQAENLLNKHYLVYYGCPAQSIRFLGGVSFRF